MRVGVGCKDLENVSQSLCPVFCIRSAWLLGKVLAWSVLGTVVIKKPQAWGQT